MKIAAQFETGDLGKMEDIFRRARRDGLLRSDFYPLIQISLVSQICVSYISGMPLYELLLSGEDLHAGKSLKSAKKFIVEAIVHGMVRED